jgi:hypothetical protein
LPPPAALVTSLLQRLRQLHRHLSVVVVVVVVVVVM